jgi:hypothetical protein
LADRNGKRRTCKRSTRACSPKGFARRDELSGALVGDAHDLADVSYGQPVAVKPTSERGPLLGGLIGGASRRVGELPYGREFVFDSPIETRNDGHVNLLDLLASHKRDRLTVLVRGLIEAAYLRQRAGMLITLHHPPAASNPLRR